MKKYLSLFLLMQTMLCLFVNSIAFGNTGSVTVKSFDKIVSDNKKTENEYADILSAENVNENEEFPFKVEIEGITTMCSTFLEAVNLANNKKADIILTSDYLIGEEDIPSEEGIYGGSQKMPVIKGINTEITLKSEKGRGPFAIKRNVKNYIDEKGNVLDSFMAVTDGAQLNIGSGEPDEAVVFDGGFTYIEDENTLSPFIDGKDMGGVFGPFIVLKNGNLNIKRGVVLKFNYSVDHNINSNSAAGFNAVIHAVEGGVSNVVIDGGYIAGNFGNGLVEAGDNCVVTLKDADIYYNSTKNISGSVYRGALTVNNGNNIIFDSHGDNERVQIRSNTSYNSDSSGNAVKNRSDNDIQVNDFLTLDGKVGIGEISIDNTSRKIYAKKSLKSEDSITVVIYNYSLNAATNSAGDFYIGVETYADEYTGEEDIFLVKIEDHYYKAVNDTPPVTGEEGVKTVVLNTINRDCVIYRANEYVDDRAKFGLVIAGGFVGGYDLAEQQKKYRNIGFDICISDNKPDEYADDIVYMSTDKIYSKGVLWNGLKEGDITDSGAGSANPITAAALGRCFNKVLNGDVGNWYWNCGFFGAEITDVPGNTKIWIRKHYEAKEGYEDYYSDWVSEFTPSVYVPD